MSLQCSSPTGPKPTRDRQRARRAWPTRSGPHPLARDGQTANWAVGRSYPKRPFACFCFAFSVSPCCRPLQIFTHTHMHPLLHAQSLHQRASAKNNSLLDHRPIATRGDRSSDLRVDGGPRTVYRTCSPYGDCYLIKIPSTQVFRAAWRSVSKEAHSSTSPLTICMYTTHCLCLHLIRSTILRTYNPNYIGAFNCIAEQSRLNCVTSSFMLRLLHNSLSMENQVFRPRRPPWAPATTSLSLSDRLTSIITRDIHSFSVLGHTGSLSDEPLKQQVSRLKPLNHRHTLSFQQTSILFRPQYCRHPNATPSLPP